MKNKKYRFQWYQHIFEATPSILVESRKYGEKLGIRKLDRDIGLYTGSSARPGNLPNYILDEIIKSNRGPRYNPE